MISYDSTFKAAAVQAAPVWFDLEATVDKAVGLIEEASAAGADVIAFPEVFLPGYPYFMWLAAPVDGLVRFMGDFHAQSPEIDGPHVARLREAARVNDIAVVIGMSERDGGTLYMTQAFIDASGNLLGRRRKLKPAHVEQTVFGEGDASDLQVHQFDFARVGALNCWEHFQPLTKFGLFRQNEQLHVAGWPGMCWYQPDVYLTGVEAQVAATRMYSLEGQTYTLCATQVVNEAAIDFFCATDEARALLGKGGGFARIFGPDGSDLATPLPEDAEGILYADIDLSAIRIAKTARDVVGHYNRPDVFHFDVSAGVTAPDASLDTEVLQVGDEPISLVDA